MTAARRGLDAAGLTRLRDRLSAHVESGAVPGLAALVACGDDVHTEVLGARAIGEAGRLRRDDIFRIASLSKPIGAAGAMALVDDGVLSVSDPVDTFLPELADRRVLRTLESPLDDTVPADRAITLEDLLTFRLGFGLIMAPPDTYPIQSAEAELGLMTLGPPWPPPSFGADEWLARFATLPLMEQPGTTWRYNTGAHVLGLLIERASGKPLEAFLRERLFEPLGMVDTSFFVPPENQDRFTTAYMPSPHSSALDLFDEPRSGWWSTPPALCNIAGMLVSTLDDFWAFVSMLEAGGRHAGGQVLSPGSVADMTRDHLRADQRAATLPFLGASDGWGYGMVAPAQAPAGAAGQPPMPWGYGWNGGTGTVWTSDRARGLTGILFTQRALASPEPPPLFVDFWEAAYGARAG
ncbi:MAG TPA: serine hydrolase domain-containing protein [Acidimicrobiales bacterium]|jgi:CubicO group peptidase (beta-lactamase class C family)|nr:serine hydrolase domain-containing protein [Acidimicrobiales bacterium]